MLATRSIFLTGAAAALAAGPHAAHAAALAAVGAPACTPVTANEALHRLRTGNARFVPVPPLPDGRNRMIHPHQSPADRRAHTGDRQCPFAVIVGCSDSRVSPEVVFDQGIGDLFDCRVAGTVIDTPVTGSIEYAIDHFHTPLIVVLGHENCGAVKAALAALDPGGSLPEASIGGLVREIIPSVRGITGATPAERLAKAVRANAEAGAATLRLSPVVKRTRATVIAAYYELGPGTVTWAAGAGA
jgi:carbonic anhydrase